jgi:transcriptional regulator with XRE-family HTH domain
MQAVRGGKVMDKVKMGKFLTQLRNDKNLRQQDEAEIFQVSPQAISKWESGESVPDIGTLEKLSNFYKVGIDEIINGEVKNPNANVSTLVVARNPSMEDRGIGKPFYGAFIYSMSAIVLALILSLLSYLPFTVSLGGGGSVTVLFNFYQVLFRSSGPLTAIVWLIALLFLASACMSIGLWLSPKKRHAYWLWQFWLALANMVINLLLFVIYVSSSLTEYNSVPLQVGSIILTLFSIVYFVLFITLPITRKKTFCPKESKTVVVADK